MNSRLMLVIGAMAGVATAAVAATAGAPTDPQIAHIAYTAGNLDIAAAKQALAKSHDPQVRDFAQLMLRDHEAVNVQALALVKKLGVTPEANGTSQALEQQAAATMRRLASLQGSAFDRAYVANEAAFHKAVNAALADTLVPSAQNGELKALLETGLTLFKEHQAHAEHLAAKV